MSAPATFVPPPPVAVMPTQPSTPSPAPPKMTIPLTENKVLGAKITLTFRGEDGKSYEATHTISGEEFKIQSHSFAVEEKHEKKRDPETKDLIGFEDTGERILTFKIRYHAR